MKKSKKDLNGVKFLSYCYAVPERVHSAIKKQRSVYGRRSSDVVLAGIMMFLQSNPEEQAKWISKALTALGGKVSRQAILKGRKAQGDQRKKRSAPAKKSVKPQLKVKPKEGASTPKKAVEVPKPVKESA